MVDRKKENLVVLEELLANSYFEIERSLEGVIRKTIPAFFDDYPGLELKPDYAESERFSEPHVAMMHKIQDLALQVIYLEALRQEKWF